MKIILSLVVFFSVEVSMANTNCEFANSIYNQGKSHYENGQFLMSLTHFSLLRGYHCNTKLSDQSEFAYLLSLWKLENTLQLEKSLDLAFNKIKTKNILKKTYIFSSFLGLSSFAKLNKQDQSKLKLWRNRHNPKNFNLIKQKMSTKQQAYLGNLQKEYGALNLKSPGLSASLSLIPGLGQVYNGTYESAAIAFGLNLLFGMATSELIKNNLNATGAASALVFSITYFGNILSAYNGAQQINSSKQSKIDQKLENFLFDFKP